jgi:hypothetical protein
LASHAQLISFDWLNFSGNCIMTIDESFHSGELQ